MGVYDRQFGFERGVLVPIQPILAHRAWRCRLLRRCGEWQGSRCAAEKSNELAPFHCCLPFRCVTGFSWFLGAGQRDGRSSARLRMLRLHLVVKTTPSVDVRKGGATMNRRRFVCAFAASAATFACVGDVSAATHEAGSLSDPSIEGTPDAKCAFRGLPPGTRSRSPASAQNFRG